MQVKKVKICKHENKKHVAEILIILQRMQLQCKQCKLNFQMEFKQWWEY